MEIKNGPGTNSEILDFPKGKVEVSSGLEPTVFLEISCLPESIGDVLEETVKIVLTQDAKDLKFDEKNTADYIRINSAFVKENLDNIFAKDRFKTPIGDNIRFSGSQLADGLYRVSMTTNWSNRLLLSKNRSGEPNFKEWFLNAARDYKIETKK